MNINDRMQDYFILNYREGNPSATPNWGQTAQCFSWLEEEDFWPPERSPLEPLEAEALEVVALSEERPEEELPE